LHTGAEQTPHRATEFGLRWCGVLLYGHYKTPKILGCPAVVVAGFSFQELCYFSFSDQTKLSRDMAEVHVFSEASFSG
jgi:hypothetical protein